jgi:DNA-binding MarR family transcriptional regulator
MAAGHKSGLRQVEAPAIDSETRVRDDHHQSLRLWLRLFACTGLIENHIRQQLQKEFSTTLPRFDLMAQLERTPDGLKMGELSRRMMVTGGNVTGITDLLEKEGLVARVIDPDDRRATRVKLTPVGRQQFGRMAREHEQWVIRLFDGLPLKTKKHLAELLGDLKQHVVRAKTA